MSWMDLLSLFQTHAYKGCMKNKRGVPGKQCLEVQGTNYLASTTRFEPVVTGLTLLRASCSWLPVSTSTVGATVFWVVLPPKNQGNQCLQAALSCVGGGLLLLLIPSGSKHTQYFGATHRYAKLNVCVDVDLGVDADVCLHVYVDVQLHVHVHVDVGGMCM